MVWEMAQAAEARTRFVLDDTAGSDPDTRYCVKDKFRSFTCPCKASRRRGGLSFASPF